MNQQTRSGPIPGIRYSAPPEELTMSTDRFLLTLERWERRKKPHGEWCLVALSLCLAFAFPLLTSDFRSTFNVPPATWQAFAMLGTFIFGCVTVGLSSRWIYVKITRPAKTSEDVLREVIEQISGELKRAMKHAADSS